MKKIIALALALLSGNVGASTFPSLPEPVSNNAVAQVETQNGRYLLSFMGLGPDKDYLAVHNKVWALKFGQDRWQEKQPVPGSIDPIGRLAGVAVGVGRYAYVFGGYTVEKSGHEVSSPDVYRYDIKNNRYKLLAPMPVPVDDSVALVYQNRYIYLVSGWHNDGNVNLVQVYDIKEDRWQQASPFLGLPVFGQAAGIADNIILVCDGVAVAAHLFKRRSYQGVAQCHKGIINPGNPLKIDWRVIRHPTGKGRYRMAATSVGDDIVFIGGSTNPYNYNGIGYNGKPSAATDGIWLFDTETDRWKMLKSGTKTMDHRGLLEVDGKLLTVGGMGNSQQVLDKITVHVADLEQLKHSD
ncbi:galactose oxidase [Thalassomonas viridans]|uniref:Galactose oxidase n=1 Tax=Thalassomonas viridans TaxID=137584 RepID=A0AAE9ZAH0_9GAMM|nr:kelch repeat-containing protein [Thalassomonas viridans]WDE09142.1 galactose oxidase [Thalassomonas viridans]